MDKNTELGATIRLLNDRLNFSGEVEGQPAISIDYIPPHGDGLGYTSLELFLLSLGSCLGSALLALLRRMGKQPAGLEMNLKGQRKTSHPTAFSSVHMHIILRSPDVEDADVAKALQTAEAGLCPVWAMIKGNVEVTTSVELVRA